MSYKRVLLQKVLIELGQEFVLDFGANLVANAVAARVQHRSFTGQDALKSFANAAVGATIKTALGAGVHETRGSILSWPKTIRANLDSGKHPQRRPYNHEKTWANEWAGNENPTRWRGGFYDFRFSAGLGALTGWVNGSMNAAVWGIPGPGGTSHVLSGGDAALDGVIAGLGGLVTAAGTSVARHLAIMGVGGRLFHRQGFAEFWIQLSFKMVERSVNTAFIVPAFRERFDPSYYPDAPK